MKILVIGQPRSRSNFLVDSLSTHFNIENIKEPYYMVDKKDTAHYYSTISKTTNDLTEAFSSFVCKLQTTDIIGNFSNFFPLIDFTGFNFDIFNSIYLTYRSNLADQLCSLIVARETGKYAYSRLKNIPVITAGSFRFDPVTHRPQIFDLSLNHLKFRMVRRFLNSKNKNYTVIEYNDSVEWVRANLPQANSNLLESRLDYKGIFVNYNEVVDIMDAVVGKND